MLPARFHLHLGRFLAAGVCVFSVASCGSDALQNAINQFADGPSNIAEIDVATAEGVSIDAESGNIAASSVPDDSPGAQAVCSLSTARSACSGSSSNVNWSSCTLSTGDGTTLNLLGGWTNNYDSNATCATVQGGNALPNSTSVVRTAAGGFTITFTKGISLFLTSDTNAHSTYSNVSIPSTGISTTVDSSGTRTIVINGFHRVLKTGGGKLLLDHSLTSTGLTVNGTRANGNRVVNGNLTTYHNLSNYTAVSTFNAVKWGTPSCCYPTGGKLTTVLSGSVQGSQSMLFTNSCGQATFTDTTGATSPVTLTNCL